MNQKRKELNNIGAMLEGEFNRMMVTKDPVEVQSMAEFAIKNIQRILVLKLYILREEKKDNGES